MQTIVERRLRTLAIEKRSLLTGFCKNSTHFEFLRISHSSRNAGPAFNTAVQRVENFRLNKHAGQTGPGNDELAIPVLILLAFKLNTAE